MIKIIWNITNQCGFHCDICATHSDREELKPSQKRDALQSILSLCAMHIRELDFSGGDPLYQEENTQIIREGIALLGRDKVCVTTTGLGLASAYARGEDLRELLYHCELTIDSIEGFPEHVRNAEIYVAKNRSEVARCLDKISNLHINVPILNPDMSEEDIASLVGSISGIGSKHVDVALLRLMDVGKMSLQRYPADYSPDRFVSTFLKYAQGTAIQGVHVQCALRGKLYGGACNMLQQKVGIDCAGNVFACAWGGYIKGFRKDRIMENPFYIGNLLEKPLKDILISDRAQRLREKIKEHPTCQCRVFCYQEGDSESIFQAPADLSNKGETIC